LQKHILDILRYQDGARYRELLPANIESSHLRYHLGQLESAGYVQKQADQGLYKLTTAGKTIVDYLSSVGTNPKQTPKVISYTLLTYGGQLLLYQKDKEPYKGLVGMIGGKVHFGEDVSAAAQREVHEKMGWDVDLPRLAGVADIRISEGNVLLSHVVAYVHVGKVAELPAKTVPQLIVTTDSEVRTHQLIPDLLPLLEAIDTHKKTTFVVSLQLTV